MRKPWNKGRHELIKKEIKNEKENYGLEIELSFEEVNDILAEIDRLRSVLDRIAKGGVDYEFGNDESLVIALQTVAARALEDQIV